jgi:hypothetical protein
MKKSKQCFLWVAFFLFAALPPVVTDATILTPGVLLSVVPWVCVIFFALQGIAYAINRE